MRSHGNIAALALTICAGVTLFSPRANAQTAPSYIFHALPVYPGDNQSTAYGVNDQGDVVGASGDPYNGQHAFLYSNGQITHLAGVGSTSQAAAINDNGQIVGTGSSINNGAAGPFRFDGTSYTNLSNGTQGSVAAINQTGDAGGTLGNNAVRFNANGTVTNLGALSSFLSSVKGINNAGVVVGFNSATGHAFRADASGIHDLGTISGSGSSQAFAINNNGVIAGSSTTASNQTHAFTNINDVFTDLGVLSGNTTSAAVAINDLGQVIGSSGTSSASVPVLFQNGQIYDLNAVTTGLGDFQLRNVYAISNTGDIVGVGGSAGVVRAFLLTPNAAPVPEASTVIGLGGMLLLAGAGFTRNRRKPAPRPA